MNTSQKSTYALLVRSEEKGRTLVETVLYTLCILSAIAAIGQFALQQVDLKRNAPETAPCVACNNDVPVAPLHG